MADGCLRSHTDLFGLHLVVIVERLGGKLDVSRRRNLAIVCDCVATRAQNTVLNDRPFDDLFDDFSSTSIRPAVGASVHGAWCSEKSQ